LDEKLIRTLKNRICRNFTIAIIAFAGTTCLWIAIHPSKEQSPGAGEENDEVTDGNRAAQESHRQRKPEIRIENENSRDQALAELKKKWTAYLDLKEGGADKNELHLMRVELAKESADRLLASRQMLDLLSFLNGAGNIPTYLRGAIERLFQAGETDRFIEPLVEAVSESYDSADSQARGNMNTWSLLLGQYGSDKAAARFRKNIDNPWPLGDFLHGWYVSRANSDPVDSYTSMVEFLKNGGKGARSEQALENVIEAFPEKEQFDFETLESLLPIGVTGSDEATYRHARRALLVRWAKDDPASAVNFIIDHSERMIPRHVTYVVEQAIKDLNYDGIEWVKDFPKGMICDRAAVAVVQRLWSFHPAEAKEWAMSIGDEKLRQDQLRNIESMQNRKHRREK